MQKLSPGSSLPYREIVKNENILLSYDVNDHAYSRKKFVFNVFEPY